MLKTIKDFPRISNDELAEIILEASEDRLEGGKSISFNKVAEILEKQSLVEIWDSKRYRDIRKELSKREYVLEICKKCVGEIQ